MIAELWLVGIGTGDPDHVTGAGMRALREASAILMPDKGAEKSALLRLRQDILARSGSTACVVPFDYPVRAGGDYLGAVHDWHDEIARRWAAACEDHEGRPVALMVWGDPSLYDSTLRIAARLEPAPKVRVIPGITAVQALTAAHGVALNTLAGAVQITTGRNIRARGWPEEAETVVVMLDGEASFTHLAPEGVTIWWGAYLGSADEVLWSGPLAEGAHAIPAIRAEARARHGWIMDTWMVRRLSDPAAME